MTLQLLDISYQYPGASAPDLTSAFSLRCGHFELGPGDFCRLAGPNGSGKTTLSKLLCGMLRPDAGRIVIDGKDLTGAPLSTFGRSVGYVFQEPAQQLFATTVKEELLFVARVMKTDDAVTQARAHDLLERFDLDDLSERSPLRLSRGQQQRLAIAAVLMQQPCYLVLDEPSSGLDDASVERLLAVCADLRAGGVGICAVTHDRRLQAPDACELRLAQGQVIA